MDASVLAAANFFTNFQLWYFKFFKTLPILKLPLWFLGEQRN